MKVFRLVSQIEGCLRDGRVPIRGAHPDDTPAHYAIQQMRLPHPVRGKVAFRLYDFQRDLVHAFERCPRLLVNAARRMGTTSLLAAYAVHYARSRANETLLMLTDRFTSGLAEAVLRFAKQRQRDVITVREDYVLFEGVSRIIIHEASGAAVRGMAINLLMIDNAAFIPHHNAHEMWTMLAPSLAFGGRAILASAPNRPKGLFYRLWNDIRRLGPDDAALLPASRMR